MESSSSSSTVTKQPFSGINQSSGLDTTGIKRKCSGDSDPATRKKSVIELDDVESDDDENRLFIDVDQKKKGHNKTQPKDDDERKQKFAAYMKGVGCNISREATQHHQDFKREITAYCGAVDIIEARKNHVRFVCATEAQRCRLLKLETVIDKYVSVTLPYAVSNQHRTSNTKRWVKGVITRVPADITDEDVKMETFAVMARRITRMNDGKAIPTTAVIIAFEDELPKEVFIHLRRYKVSVYIPKPIRCNNCQVFGHKAAECEASTTVCSRCSSKSHDYSTCTVDKSESKCANCGGNHSAAYKGCIRYKTVNAALTISTKQGISYRDAVLQVKKRAAENPKPATSTNNVPPQELINSEIQQDSKKPPETIAKPKQRPRKAKLTLRKPVVSAAINRMRPKASTRISDFPARAPTPSSSQTAETKKASTSPPTTQLREDQMLCLITTTTTALLWVIRNMPATTGQLQIVSQLNTVMAVLGQLRKRTEKQMSKITPRTLSEAFPLSSVIGEVQMETDNSNDVHSDVGCMVGKSSQPATQ